MKKGIFVVLSMILVLLICVFTFDKTSKAEYSPIYTYEYDNEDPLFAATHFHLFAESKIQSFTHTHGNVACNFYEGTSDFGTRVSFYPNNNSTEITYIRNIININPTINAGALVLGAQYKVVSPSNSGQKEISDGINSFKLDSFKGNILNEDKYIPFINLEQEFIKLRGLSATFSNKENSNIIYDFSDWNNHYIDLSTLDLSTKVYILNIKKEMLSTGTPLIVKGLNPDGIGYLVLNVDLAGEDIYSVSLSEMKCFYLDGSPLNSGEYGPEKYGTARILFNFYDSTENDKTYKGELYFTPTLFGSILAPSATLHIGMINGTAIAKNIIHDGGESHRRDIIPGIGKIIEKKEGITSTLAETTSINPNIKENETDTTEVTSETIVVAKTTKEKNSSMNTTKETIKNKAAAKTMVETKMTASISTTRGQTIIASDQDVTKKSSEVQKTTSVTKSILDTTKEKIVSRQTVTTNKKIKVETKEKETTTTAEVRTDQDNVVQIKVEVHKPSVAADVDNVPSTGDATTNVYFLLLLTLGAVIIIYLSIKNEK